MYYVPDIILISMDAIVSKTDRSPALVGFNTLKQCIKLYREKGKWMIKIKGNRISANPKDPFGDNGYELKLRTVSKVLCLFPQLYSAAHMPLQTAESHAWSEI